VVHLHRGEGAPGQLGTLGGQELGEYGVTQKGMAKAEGARPGRNVGFDQLAVNAAAKDLGGLLLGQAGDGWQQGPVETPTEQRSGPKGGLGICTKGVRSTPHVLGEARWYGGPDR
jgi:hypothetical protein